MHQGEHQADESRSALQSSETNGQLLSPERPAPGICNMQRLKVDAVGMVQQTCELHVAKRHKL